MNENELGRKEVKKRGLRVLVMNTSTHRLVEREWSATGALPNNPMKANMCHHAVDYKYSSAAFYKKGDMTFDFLTRFDG
jgi:hypothetical protein